MGAQVHEVHQQIILARLHDFHDLTLVRKDGLDSRYDLTAKLQDILDHVYQLKQEQLLHARDRFVDLLQINKVTDRDITDFKAILDPYLDIGDYADIVFHLIPSQLAIQAKRDFAIKAMGNLKAASLAEEEKKPDEQKSSRTKKLMAEIYARLSFDLCEKTLGRQKAEPARRCRLVLHRMGLRTKEYCTVLHFPSSPDDTFSPFLLTRVEAMLICCMRLLSKFPN